MKNKTNEVPYPYYFLETFLKSEVLEVLVNNYERKKSEAYFNQMRYAKKKSIQNRYRMNYSFFECSEYKLKIKQVRKWIKDLEKERNLQKENEQLKQQIEKAKCCFNCKKYKLKIKQRPLNCVRFQRTLFYCDDWELAE